MGRASYQNTPGTNYFDPLGSTLPGVNAAGAAAAISITVGFNPFGQTTPLLATAGGGNRWIAYSGVLPLLVETAAGVFTMTVQQRDGRGRGNAASSATAESRRLVRLFASAAAGTVLLAAGAGGGTINANPVVAAGAAATAVMLPSAGGLLIATFTFSLGQAGNIITYDDGYQQFRCTCTSTA